MRVLFGHGSPPSASCERWAAARTTSTREGRVQSREDHFRVGVHLLPGESPETAFKRVRRRLVAYDIFPPWLIRHALCPPPSIATGTTIVQQIVLGPVMVEMAVRVVAVWNDDRRDGRTAGFSYVTVEGHAECGVATFEVRLEERQRVVVCIAARSRAGTRLTRLGYPVTRLVQRAHARGPAAPIASMTDSVFRRPTATYAGIGLDSGNECTGDLRPPTAVRYQSESQPPTAGERWSPLRRAVYRHRYLP